MMIEEYDEHRIIVLVHDDVTDGNDNAYDDDESDGHDDADCTPTLSKH